MLGGSSWFPFCLKLSDCGNKTKESFGYSNTSFWTATIILFLLLAYLLLRKYSPNALSNSISYICKCLASAGTENHCSSSDEGSLASRRCNAQGNKQLKRGAICCLREYSLRIKPPTYIISRGSIALAYGIGRMTGEDVIEWESAKLEPLGSRTEDSMPADIEGGKFSLSLLISWIILIILILLLTYIVVAILFPETTKKIVDFLKGLFSGDDNKTKSTDNENKGKKNKENKKNKRKRDNNVTDDESSESSDERERKKKKKEQSRSRPSRKNDTKNKNEEDTDGEPYDKRKRDRTSDSFKPSENSKSRPNTVSKEPAGRPKRGTGSNIGKYGPMNNKTEKSDEKVIMPTSASEEKNSWDADNKEQRESNNIDDRNLKRSASEPIRQSAKVGFNDDEPYEVKSDPGIEHNPSNESVQTKGSELSRTPTGLSGAPSENIYAPTELPKTQSKKDLKKTKDNKSKKPEADSEPKSKQKTKEKKPKKVDSGKSGKNMAPTSSKDIADQSNAGKKNPKAVKSGKSQKDMESKSKHKNEPDKTKQPKKVKSDKSEKDMGSKSKHKDVKNKNKEPKKVKSGKSEKDLGLESKHKNVQNNSKEPKQVKSGKSQKDMSSKNKNKSDRDKSKEKPPKKVKSAKSQKDMIKQP